MSILNVGGNGAVVEQTNTMAVMCNFEATLRQLEMVRGFIAVLLITLILNAKISFCNENKEWSCEFSI